MRHQNMARVDNFVEQEELNLDMNIDPVIEDFDDEYQWEDCYDASYQQQFEEQVNNNETRFVDIIHE